jgi:hypothetical protein
LICADFLAGAHQQVGNWELVLAALRRTFELLPGERQLEFLHSLGRQQLPVLRETG